MVSNKSIELFERLFLRQKAASYFDLLNQEDLTRQVRRLSAKLPYSDINSTGEFLSPRLSSPFLTE